MKNKNDRQEQALRILEAMSAVDEELLARSEEAGKAEKKTFLITLFRYKRTLAVACCLIALGGMCYSVGRVMLAPRGASETPDTAAAFAMLQEAGVTSENSMEEAVDAGSGTEKLTEEMQESMTAGLTAESPGAPGMESSDSSAAYGNAAKENQQGETAMEELQTWTNAGEDEVQQANEVNGGQIQDITLQQAGDLVLLGAYVPKVLPEGFAFEAGRYGKLNEQECLYLAWTKGCNEITLSIETAEPETVTLTDITHPETYDVHLYTSPYADSVPDKYVDSFYSPVFQLDQLTEELIASRMYSVEDAGDGDSQKGNFGVYDDEAQVLICFSGNGSKKEIMELFASMK